MPLMRQVSVALLLALGLCCTLLGGCRSGQEDARETASMPIPAQAPQAGASRVGAWEPLSGKLGAGIAVYQRPFTPVLGKPFDLVLRFEGVIEDDACVRLSTSDGARLVPEGAEFAWRLGAGVASQVVVQVIAPPGKSYVNVMTTQKGRVSSMSIAMSLPSPPGQPAAGYRDGDDVDASGEPIIRMRAKPEKK